MESGSGSAAAVENSEAGSDQSEGCSRSDLDTNTNDTGAQDLPRGDVRGPAIVAKWSEADGGYELSVDDDVAVTGRWPEELQSDTIAVTCKNLKGVLDKSRLGSGNKGRCIKYNDQWVTPVEFEALSGLGGSKDWKRTIKYRGHPLQGLIDDGLLLPHAACCACAVCLEDDTVTTPVRLFTPYRKRKYRQLQMATLAPNSISLDSEPDGGSSGPQVKRPATVAPPSGGGAAPSDQEVDITSLPAEQMWDKLEEMSRSLLQQALALKQTIRVCRETHLERLATASATNGNGSADGHGTALAAAAEAASEPQQKPSSNILPRPVPAKPAIRNRKCAGCDTAVSTLECPECGAVGYCSLLCYQRHWPAHRASHTGSGSQQGLLLILSGQNVVTPR